MIIQEERVNNMKNSMMKNYKHGYINECLGGGARFFSPKNSTKYLLFEKCVIYILYKYAFFNGNLF